MATRAEEKRTLKIAELMTKIGKVRVVDKPTDDATIQYPVCDVCQGFGMVYHPTQDTDDPMYGKVIDCPTGCEAAIERRKKIHANMIVKMQYVTKRRDAHLNYDFKKYAQGDMSNSRAVALDIAQDFVRDLHVEIAGKVKPGLVFCGPNGTGKTSLVSAIVTELDRLGHQVWYSRVEDILKAVLEAMQWDSAIKPDELKDFYATIPILVMDEFDIQGLSSWDKYLEHRQIIENILDHRVRMQLPTLSTTNLDHESVKKRWGDRIGDRLIETAHWFEITGKIRDNTPIYRVEGA